MKLVSFTRIISRTTLNVSAYKKDVGLMARLFFICSFFISNMVQADTIRIPRDVGDIPKLPNKLLVAALKRGNQYDSVFPYGDIASLPFSTRLQGVRNNELDIFNAMSSRELENEFQAIYIPIYKGLMGMRLAIVKQSNRELFSRVESLQDLKQFTAGQGTYWADSKILEANNLPLVKEMKYSNMFRMLEAERYDFFPRGAHEPWAEVEQRPELNLTVDPHIMLSYKAPFYFFVPKNNKQLAKHLTEQLNAMIEDGSFEEIFYNDAEVEKALTQGNFQKRRIIELLNPQLSDNTPTNRSELWYNPAEDHHKY